MAITFTTMHRLVGNPVSARGLHANFALYRIVHRHIHTAPPVSKSAKETISDVADKVNRKVGEGLAAAIETGEKATEKTKKTLGASKRAKGKAERPKEGVDRTGQKAKQTSNNVTAAAKEAGKSTRKDV